MPDQWNLTLREREVARLLVQRYTNQEIACELVISIRTAEWHAGNIMGQAGRLEPARAPQVARQPVVSTGDRGMSGVLCFSRDTTQPSQR